MRRIIIVMCISMPSLLDAMHHDNHNNKNPKSWLAVVDPYSMIHTEPEQEGVVCREDIEHVLECYAAKIASMHAQLYRGTLSFDDACQVKAFTPEIIDVLNTEPLKLYGHIYVHVPTLVAMMRTLKKEAPITHRDAKNAGTIALTLREALKQCKNRIIRKS